MSEVVNMIRLDMDIPMPETCSQCPLCYNNSYNYCRAKDICFGKEDDWICETRPNWCPLQEITPVKPIKRGNAWECGKCNQILGIVGDNRLDSYCRSCGTKVNWDG